MLATGGFDFANGSDGLSAGVCVEEDESTDDQTDPYVLLVDDDADCLRLLRAIVELDGHRCLTARSGQDALTSCDEAGLPRLVVTDWNMPGIDGETLAQRLKDRDPALPIFLITGRDPDEVPSASRERLFSAVLTKPLNPATLTRAISNLPTNPGSVE